jgi:2-dehydropantoate 2-reductase
LFDTVLRIMAAKFSVIRNTDYKTPSGITMKNILIVGTGALGTLFAARLAGGGANVTMLGSWKNAIETINHDGVRLLQSDGTEMQFPVRATNDPAECKDADLAIVLVKAWQTELAAQQLEKCLPEQAVAITLQNGLGNREALSARLGAGRVVLGVTTTGATLLGPGLARMGGEGLVSIESHPRSRELSSFLRHAGFRVEIVPDAESLIWGKLVINTAINPLTALLHIPNGDLLKRPGARKVMGALARETAAVAVARGVPLPFTDPVSAAEDVARRTAKNRSSMFQDVKRGAPTEIDAICGAVVRAGEERGIQAPVNWTMWQLVSAIRHSA